MYGVREDNKRELLCLEVNPTEGANSRGECLESLKRRGVDSVDLIVAEGLAGLEN